MGVWKAVDTTLDRATVPERRNFEVCSAHEFAYVVRLARYAKEG